MNEIVVVITLNVMLLVVGLITGAYVGPLITKKKPKKEIKKESNSNKLSLEKLIAYEINLELQNPVDYLKGSVQVGRDKLWVNTNALPLQCDDCSVSAKISLFRVGGDCSYSFDMRDLPEEHFQEIKKPITILTKLGWDIWTNGEDTQYIKKIESDTDSLKSIEDLRKAIATIRAQCWYLHFHKQEKELLMDKIKIKLKFLE